MRFIFLSAAMLVAPTAFAQSVTFRLANVFHNYALVQMGSISTCQLNDKNVLAKDITLPLVPDPYGGLETGRYTSPEKHVYVEVSCPYLGSPEGACNLVFKLGADVTSDNTFGRISMPGPHVNIVQSSLNLAQGSPAQSLRLIDPNKGTANRLQPQNCNGGYFEATVGGFVLNN